MSRHQIFALLLLIVAFMVVVVGFSVYASASLPYQDPTPELLLRQHHDIQRGKGIFFGGLIALILDAAWLWITWKRAK